MVHCLGGALGGQLAVLPEEGRQLQSAFLTPSIGVLRWIRAKEDLCPTDRRTGDPITRQTTP